MKFLALVASLPIIAFALEADATPITYDLTSLGRDPFRNTLLTGTITTDGTLGALSPSNILGWEWGTIGDEVSLVVANTSDLNTTVAITPDGVLEATSSSIFIATPTLPAAGLVTSNSLLLLGGNPVVGGGGSYSLAFGYNAYNTTSPPLWTKFVGAQVQQGNGEQTFYSLANDFNSPPGDFVIATASAAPEPSSMLLAALGVAALLAYRWRRDHFLSRQAIR